MNDWIMNQGAPRYWVQLIVGAIFLGSVAEILYHLS